MRIYIAAPFAARALAAEVAVQLEDAGHTVTSTWLNSTRGITEKSIGISEDSTHEDVLAHANGDLDDVFDADVLFMLTGAYCQSHTPGLPDAWLHTGGRHVEFGAAVTLKRPIHLLGEPENIFGRAYATSHPTVESFLAHLNEGA